MMKSIVAAVDGSQESLIAMKHAAVLATRLDAELRGVFVEDERRFVTFPTYSDSEGRVPRPIPLPAEELEAEEERVKAEAEDLRGKFEKLAAEKKARADWQVVRGRINDVLVTEARCADMTVIGKKGHKTAPELHDTGPTTQAVIHEALRPVLVVPRDAPLSGPVLVAFDGNRSVQRMMVAGAELAAALKAPVTVLTVNDDPQEAAAIQAPLHRYLNAYGLKTTFRVKAGEKSAADHILSAAREMKAGMIIMGAFSHSEIKQFFFGSVTRTVLAGTPCPVLLMT